MRLVDQAILAQPTDHFLHVVAGFVVGDVLDPLVVVPGIFRVPSATGLLTRVVGGDRLEDVATEHFEQASIAGRANRDWTSPQSNPSTRADSVPVPPRTSRVRRASPSGSPLRSHRTTHRA